MTVDRVRAAALETLAQDAAMSNVRNLRASRGQVYDVNAERRSLDFDVYEWSLIVIGLEKLGSRTATELAALTRMRLQHPSAQVAIDSDPTPAHGTTRPSA